MRTRTIRYEILTWDHRQGPSWSRITNLIADGGRYLVEVETGDDSEAIVIADTPITAEQAQYFYDKEYA
jgi:hypothetical protein